MQPISVLQAVGGIILAHRVASLTLEDKVRWQLDRSELVCFFIDDIHSMSYLLFFPAGCLLATIEVKLVFVMAEVSWNLMVVFLSSDDTHGADL